MALQRMVLVPTEMWETRYQASPPPVKQYLTVKTTVIKNG